MPTTDIPRMLLDTVKEHLPPGAEWAPLAAAGVLAAIGLLFMVKGARLAPVLAALVFAGAGAALGPLLSSWFQIPLWPTVGGCAAAGLLLGVILFRIWLALLVGGCLAVVSLAVYSGQVLRIPLNDYLSAGLDRQQQLVTLPQAGSPLAPSTDVQKELVGLWTFLDGKVPNFQTSVLAIVGSAALAGLIFGLLLPKLARAFWAASFGTLLLTFAAGSAVQLHWPQHMPWLLNQGLIVAGILWLISLAYNWADVHHAGLKKSEPAPAKPATA